MTFNIHPTDLRMNRKRPSFALQKAMFCRLKGRLLEPKRRPFGKPAQPNRKPTPTKGNTHPSHPEGRELRMPCLTGIYTNSLMPQNHIQLPPFGRVGVGVRLSCDGCSLWLWWVFGCACLGVPYYIDCKNFTTASLSFFGRL